MHRFHYRPFPVSSPVAGTQDTLVETSGNQTKNFQEHISKGLLETIESLRENLIQTRMAGMLADRSPQPNSQLS